MTFEEWKTAFISNERPEMIEMFKVAWNAGQLAMRERATDAVDEFDACSPHYIADKIRQLEPE